MNSSYDENSRGIKYSRQEGIKYDNVHSNSFIVLGHELYHAYEHDLGKLGLAINSSNGVIQAEVNAVFFENYLRASFSLPLRSHYSGKPIYSNDIVANQFSNERIKIKTETIYVGSIVAGRPDSAPQELYKITRTYIHYSNPRYLFDTPQILNEVKSKY
ncbi:MAG: hypothetical protein SF052_18085 [Bacteroidia bacterium]|nr:hypothetical protein [Bacteroidia bacterium]